MASTSGLFQIGACEADSNDMASKGSGTSDRSNW
jgi:hypothetical protein